MENFSVRADELEGKVDRLETNQHHVMVSLGELRNAIERLTRSQASVMGQDNGGAAGQNNNGEVEAMELENDGPEERNDVTKGEKNKVPDNGKAEKDKDKAGKAEERKDMSNAQFNCTDIR